MGWLYRVLARVEIDGLSQGVVRPWESGGGYIVLARVEMVGLSQTLVRP